MVSISTGLVAKHMLPWQQGLLQKTGLTLDLGSVARSSAPSKQTFQMLRETRLTFMAVELSLRNSPHSKGWGQR